MGLADFREIVEAYRGMLQEMLDYALEHGASQSRYTGSSTIGLEIEIHGYRQRLSREIL